MGLSFHDESSMVEASIRSSRFAPDDLNPMPENWIIDKEKKYDDSDI